MRFPLRTVALTIAVFAIPELSLAQLVLPTTPCDAVQAAPIIIYGVDQHLVPGMTREDGTKAFTYGADNNSFVSASGRVFTFSANLLFQPVFALAPLRYSAIKIYAFDTNCQLVFGIGPVFTLESTETVLTLDLNANQAGIFPPGLHSQSPQQFFPQSIPRYVWIEVVDMVPPAVANIATFSYLVDLQNPQNPQPTARPVPVVLTHGFCGDPTVFGRMTELLRSDGQTVSFAFDYTDMTKVPSFGQTGVPIEDLAFIFAGHISRVLQLHRATQVDVVAHSMGALIARAWMAGMTTAPYRGEIRRLITVATPHYGASPARLDKIAQTVSFLSGGDFACSTTQMQQLRFGSSFIWRLHDKWAQFQQGPFAIPANQMLFVAGTQDVEDAFWECNRQGCDDGVVQISSAVLPDTLSSQVRYVPYKHSDVWDLPGNGLAVINVIDRTHKTYLLVKEFLATGRVVAQCCDEGTVDYRPPHVRGDRRENEGLLLIRVRDARTQQPASFSRANVSFRPRAGSVSEQTNDSAGTITVYGLPQDSYAVDVKPHEFLPVTLLGVPIFAARPTVLEPITLIPR